MIIRCAGCGINLADPTAKSREPCSECGEIVRAVSAPTPPWAKSLPTQQRKRSIVVHPPLRLWILIGFMVILVAAKLW